MVLLVTKSTGSEFADFSKIPNMVSINTFETFRVADILYKKILSPSTVNGYTVKESFAFLKNLLRLIMSWLVLMLKAFLLIYS